VIDRYSSKYREEEGNVLPQGGSAVSECRSRRCSVFLPPGRPTASGRAIVLPLLPTTPYPYNHDGCSANKINNVATSLITLHNNNNIFCFYILHLHCSSVGGCLSAAEMPHRTVLTTVQAEAHGLGRAEARGLGWADGAAWTDPVDPAHCLGQAEGTAWTDQVE